MALKTVKAIDLLDIFKSGHCDVCGVDEVNQYFNINNSYIGYLGIFLPLREILINGLGIKIDHNAGKTMEICLDCKDKVVKMYHFKKKVDEVQKNQKNFNSKKKTSCQQEKPKISKKYIKIVQNIYQIIESYAEKFSITAIRVNEKDKKLIIESSNDNENEETFEEPTTFKETPIIIKTEPFDEADETCLTEDSEDNDSDAQEDDSDTWRLSNFKKRVSFKRASTSNDKHIPSKKSKFEISSPIKIKQRLDNCASSSNNVKIPATNESELLKLTEEITNDEEYGHRLGMELIRIIQERIDGQERTSLYVIRSMIKLMTSQSVYLNMNMSGKVSRALQGIKDKTIKAPEDFMIFLAKYSSVLTGDDEEKSYKDVKKVISRIISDWTRDRKRGIQNFFEKEQFKLDKEVESKEKDVNVSEEIFVDPLN